MNVRSESPWSRPDGPRSRTRVLTCGDAAGARWSRRLADALPDAVTHAVAPRPGRAEVDPLLDGVGLLVVAGDDADLAAVLMRLLRRERLDVPVALLPDPDSIAAGVWGVPTDPGAAVALLRSAVPRPRPLVRDDRGGVVAGAHEVDAFHGAVYADAHLVASGPAAGLVVRPWAGDEGSGGVEVTVTGPPRWAGMRAGRTASARGRAVQIGCRPATLRRDGVPDERPLERRSWYRHVEDWHLLLP